MKAVAKTPNQPYTCSSSCVWEDADLDRVGQVLGSAGHCLFPFFGLFLMCVIPLKRVFLCLFVFVLQKV